MTQEARKRVLVVDDEAGVRNLVGATLAGLYDVDTAVDGREGLEKLTDGYDVLFTDLNMPKLDGVGLIKGAREHGFKGRIYLMTSDLPLSPSQDDVKKLLIERGYPARHGISPEQVIGYCTGFIPKPFSPMALITKLGSYKPQ